MNRAMCGWALGGLAVVLCAGRGVRAQCGDWDNPFGGWLSLNDSVLSLVSWDPDGAAPQPAELVAGGYFTVADGMVVNCVARWDPGSPGWQPLGAGVNGPVLALTTWDPDGPGASGAQLIAGGYFVAAGGDQVGFVARWDGTAWHDVGGGVDHVVSCLTTWDPDGDGPLDTQLVAGGLFDTAGGVTANGVARWDGSSWHGVGNGLDAQAGVYTLTTWDPDGDGPLAKQLVAGGWIPTADGAPVGHVARWDGSDWHALGGGVVGAVFCLTTWDPDGDGPLAAQLVAGGRFDTAGGVVVNHIARWDGAAWHALGGGADDGVYAVMSWDPDGVGPSDPLLVAGGAFTAVGGAQVDYVARWDGSSWRGFGVGTDSFTNAFCTWDPDGDGPRPQQLIAGGGFTAAGRVPAGFSAMWSTLGPAFTAEPQDASVPWGSAASFAVTVRDGPASFQWRRNGMALSNGATPGGSTISGARSDMLIITNTRLSDAGMYDCVAADSCGATVSHPALLSVASPACAGDANGDGLVNGRDLSVLLSQYGDEIPPGTAADFNGDGVVNGLDLSVLLANFGLAC